MTTSTPAVTPHIGAGPEIGFLMVFEHIEKLKREYTDKYVVVDETCPELRRFGGMTGTVRTVNMSGRALVEFDAYSNIGWYDIDVDFLKVIDAPLPKPEAKPAAKKAEAKAGPKAAPAAKKAAPAAKKASGAGMSVADMLAAARGDKGGAAAPVAKPSSAAEIMAAARSEKSGGAAPAKVDPKSMSVTDMLAAARGEKAGGGTSTAAPKASSADPKGGVREMLEAARKPKPGAVATEPPAAEEAAAEEAAAEEAAAPESASSGSGQRRNDITSVAEQLAYCRQVDVS